MPTLIPVDHDPFAQPESGGLTFTPIDYDPFAIGPERTATGHARELGVGVPRGIGTGAGLALQGASALEGDWWPKYQDLLGAVESVELDGPLPPMERFGQMPAPVAQSAGPDRDTAIAEAGAAVERAQSTLAAFDANPPKHPRKRRRERAPLLRAAEEARAALEGARALPAAPPAPGALASLDESIRGDMDLPPRLKQALRQGLRRRAAGEDDPLAEARLLIPAPLAERPLFRAGEAVTEAATEAFPRAPGYEDALSGTVGEGLGSLALGVGVGLASGPASPVTLTTLFGSMGAGEAAERARMAGASPEQVADAARLGVLAGSTDVVPLEVLLRRVPGPAREAVGELADRVGARRVVEAAARVGVQGLVEGVQEGVQQFAQNLIAREVHSPDASLTEGIVSGAGVGGIVGSIAGLGREGVIAIGRRRSGSATGDRARAVAEVPPPSPEDEASPLPTDAIQEGREAVADAMAAERANQRLDGAGIPHIGMPVRLNDGTGRMVEGVVTDAETDAQGAVAAVSVTVADHRFGGPMEIEFTPDELAARGIQIEGMPMPPSREEQQRIAQEGQRAREQIRQADESADQRAAEDSRALRAEAERAGLVDALAGTSHELDAGALGEALAGLSGTPDGTKMLRALAGTERTPAGEMVMEVLAGGAQDVTLVDLGAALTGMQGSPDGDALLQALTGRRPDQRGRRGEGGEMRAGIGEVGEPRRPRTEFQYEPETRRRPEPMGEREDMGATQLPEGRPRRPRTEFKYTPEVRQRPDPLDTTGPSPEGVDARGTRRPRQEFDYEPEIRRRPGPLDTSGARSPGGVEPGGTRRPRGEFEYEPEIRRRPGRLDTEGIESPAGTGEGQPRRPRREFEFEPETRPTPGERRGPALTTPISRGEPRRPRVEPELVTRADGQPFKSRQSAMLAARNKRMEDAEPVEHAGGWALRRAGRSAPIEITDTDVMDSSFGESQGLKLLKVDGENKAAVQLRTSGNEVDVMMVETRPEERGKGYAKQLIDDVFREYPDHIVRITNTTEEGTAFFEKNYEVRDDGEIRPIESAALGAPDTAADSPARDRPAGGLAEVADDTSAGVRGAGRRPEAERIDPATEGVPEELRTLKGWESAARQQRIRLDAALRDRPPRERSATVNATVQEVADEMGVQGWNAVPPPRRQEFIERMEARVAEAESQAAAPIVRKNGQPFASEKSAALAAKSQGIIAEPVRVQEGWALRRMSAEDKAAKAVKVLPETRAEVYTPDIDTAIETDFAVIDAADLLVSHDEQGRPDPRYPAEIQPRERERGTSQAWIRKTSGDLKPGALRASPLTDSGAPVIGSDGAVESGNGRAAAIRLAYRRGLADSYREMVEEQAKDAGIDVSGMQAPVLVRLRKGGIADRTRFARQSNAPTAARLSASEQAKQDVDLAGRDVLERYARDPSEAVGRFVQALPATEHTAMFDAEGRPSKDLRDRVRNAVLWQAYESDSILRAAAESEDPDGKQLLTALTTAAPRFAEVDDGVKTALNAAVDRIATARATGMNNKQILEQVVGQQELIPDETFDDGARAVAQAILERARSGKRMGEYLVELGERARRAEESAAYGGQDLLGEVPAVDVATVARQADDATRAPVEVQGALLQRAPDDPGTIDPFDVDAAGRAELARMGETDAQVRSWQTFDESATPPRSPRRGRREPTRDPYTRDAFDPQGSLFQRRLIHGTSADFESGEIQPGHDGLVHLSENEVEAFKRDFQHVYESEIDTDDMPVLPDLRTWNPVHVGQAMVRRGLLTEDEWSEAATRAGVTPDNAEEVADFDILQTIHDLESALGIEDRGETDLDSLMGEAEERAYEAEEFGDDFLFDEAEIGNLRALNARYLALRENLYSLARSKGIRAFKYRNVYERGAAGYSVGVIDPDILTPEGRRELFQRRTGTAPAPRPQPAPATARIRLQRRFSAEQGRVKGDIERIGRDVFGKHFAVRVAESIEAPDGTQATGAYDPANRVAYVALRSQEGMTASVAHEGLHHLRNMGAFTDAQGADTAPWKTLEREADARWIEQYGIEERYGPDTEGMDAAQRQRLMREEAIAEALADFQTRGRETGFGPTVRSALTRILNYFRRLANGLRGRGFRTARDIFESDIATGEAGRRADARQGRETALDRQLMTAWHGSPHRFDRFSTEGIGGGEGTQFEGWGLYFSGKKEVAQWYRDTLSRGRGGRLLRATVGGESFTESQLRPEVWSALRGMTQSLRKGDIEDVAVRFEDLWLDSQAQESISRDEGRLINAFSEKIDEGSIDEIELEADDAETASLYRVDLAPAEDEYLLWREPLAAQSEKVKAALESLGIARIRGPSNTESTGIDAYHALAEQVGGEKEASMRLRAAGVRGTKYPTGDGSDFNYVIFDDADVAIEEVLLQRGKDTPESNKRAFDESVSRYTGADLRGAAEATIADKERMGGLAETIKTQVQGIESVRAKNVEVKEAHVASDLFVGKRWVVPPHHATRKQFPAIHSLIMAGIEGEKKISNWTQRLDKRWDRTTKKLSKAEFADLTGVLFLGDAEAHVFTDAELDGMELSPKVKEAYRKSRRLLDAMGTMVENHNRKMTLPALARRTKLLRRLANAVGQDAATFRTLYNARAKLLEQQRRGDGDPEELSAAIDKATEALYGADPAAKVAQAARDRGDDIDPARAVERFESEAAEADRISARLADNKIKRRVGYVPHKFFGRWRIFRKTGEIDEDGKPKYEHIAGEHGFWPTRSDAIRAASHMARKDPDGEYQVSQVEFDFPAEEATQLSDAAFFRFIGNVQDLTGLKGDDLREAIQGTARRRFRRRIAGFAQYRKGVKGYSKNLDRVMRTHIGQTVRHIILDELKYRAINTMEKEGLSENRTTVQSRPELAAMVQSWWRDVNGQKQPFEQGVDAVLAKPWASPLKAGTAAGAAAFVASKGVVGVATMGAAGSVMSLGVPLAVAGYVGYRVGRALSQGGVFPSRSLAGAALGDMSHLKLGMVFNLMSPAVNLLQTATNTVPVLGTKWTGVGVKRFSAAVSSRLRGKPNADWRQLERANIRALDTFAEGTAHAFKKPSRLGEISMSVFQGAESFNRGVAFLGGLSKAQDEGKSPAEQRVYANHVMDRTQLNYEKAAKPELLRNNFLRVPLQFKNYVVQQLGFVLGLRGAELARFATSITLVAGALGLPFADLFDELTQWITEKVHGKPWSPIMAAKMAAIDSLEDGGITETGWQIFTRGLPGAAGVDFLGRVGMGDKFLPTEMRDFWGPWASTVLNAVRHGQEGVALTDQLRNLSPGIGGPLKALESWANGGEVSNPWKGGKIDYVATPRELMMKAIGARPIREARLQDIREHERMETMDRRMQSRRVVNRYVSAMRDGNRAEAQRILADARRRGVTLNAASIRRAMREHGTVRPERELRQLPRDMRREALGRRQAVEQAATQ